MAQIVPNKYSQEGKGVVVVFKLFCSYTRNTSTQTIISHDKESLPLNHKVFTQRKKDLCGLQITDHPPTQPTSQQCDQIFLYRAETKCTISPLSNCERQITHPSTQQKQVLLLTSYPSLSMCTRYQAVSQWMYMPQ